MRNYVDPPDVKAYGNIKVTTEQIKREVERLDMPILMLLCDIYGCGYHEPEKLIDGLEKTAKKSGNWA